MDDETVWFSMGFACGFRNAGKIESLPDGADADTYKRGFEEGVKHRADLEKVATALFPGDPFATQKAMRHAFNDFFERWSRS